MTVTIPEGTRWVWFDLDNTLIDFTANARDALATLYRREHLDRFFESLQQWTDRYEEYNHELWRLYSLGEIAQDRLRLDRFRLPFLSAGADEETAVALARRFDTDYLDLLAEGRRMIDGAVELLSAVSRDPELHVGIISNGFHDVQHRKIRNTGILPLVELIVLSDDIGINKPDRRIFDYAVEKSGVADSRAHLIIGDNPDTDIRGALGAGWRAIWFDRDLSDAETPEGATRVRTLGEIAVRKK
ncbi:MAG: YjjG family noncanonical pyrimidine nucleotidase [Clostridium sp.]|nr:YjjG family noncanonical pyrimidine nucleotidase [Clostridium sp.]